MLRDVNAQNASLDNDYGPGRGAAAPAALEVALLATRDVESEIAGTTEGAANGYVRPTLSSNDFAAAAGGIKLSPPAPFGPPTQAWETARWAALIDPATSITWDVVPLSEPLTVTGAAPAFTVQLAIAGNGDNQE